jgi:hypothetical protein
MTNPSLLERTGAAPPGVAQGRSSLSVLSITPDGVGERRLSWRFLPGSMLD